MNLNNLIQKFKNRIRSDGYNEAIKKWVCIVHLKLNVFLMYLPMGLLAIKIYLLHATHIHIHTTKLILNIHTFLKNLLQKINGQMQGI